MTDSETEPRLADLVATAQAADNDRQAALHAALARAQARFKPLKRSKTVRVSTKTGGTYEFAYAPLDTVLEMVRGPLAEEGLAVTQRLDVEDVHTVLRTEVLHAAGGVLASVWPISQRGTAQEFGSALTYLRRYTLVALLGLASEDDDDGNAEAGNTTDEQPAPKRRAAKPPPGGGLISDAQRSRLFAIAKEAAVGEEQLRDVIRGHTGDPSTKTIRVEQYDLIVAELQAMQVPF